MSIGEAGGQKTEGTEDKGRLYPDKGLLYAVGMGKDAGERAADGSAQLEKDDQ